MIRENVRSAWFVLIVNGVLAQVVLADKETTTSAFVKEALAQRRVRSLLRGRAILQQRVRHKSGGVSIEWEVYSPP